MRRFFLVASLVLLAGCKIGPNYQRPAVPAPEAFQYELNEAQDTANTAWWRQFLRLSVTTTLSTRSMS